MKQNLAQLLKFLPVMLLVIIVGVFGVVIATAKNAPATAESASAVNIVDGVQVIDLTAKVGYSPAYIQAKSGVPTKLRVTTKNTFDCSSALVIPAKGIRRNLPPTGITELDLGTAVAGSELTGTCTMGMYDFQIKFI